MYTVNLSIIQAPGAMPYNLIMYKQEGTYDGYSLLPMKLKVEKQARLKVKIGFFNTRYIDFTGGKKTKGTFNATITMGDVANGIKIIWGGGGTAIGIPPHKIKMWSFL